MDLNKNSDSIPAVGKFKSHHQKSFPMHKHRLFSQLILKQNIVSLQYSWQSGISVLGACNWNSVVEFQLCLLTYADPVIQGYLGSAFVLLESNSSANLRPLKIPLLTSDMLHRGAQLVRTLPLLILVFIVELQSTWIFLFYCQVTLDPIAVQLQILVQANSLRNLHKKGNTQEDEQLY